MSFSSLARKDKKTMYFPSMVWKGKEIAISLKRSTMYFPSMVWKDKGIQISLTRTQ